MSTIWASRDRWRSAPTSAGSLAVGTYHAYDEALNPAPGPGVALCRATDDITYPRNEPPLWGSGGGPSRICRRCWVYDGRDIETLNERDRKAVAQRERQRASDRSFDRWRADQRDGRSGVVYFEDIVTLLSRYEVYEPADFVKEALADIKKARETP